jgi:hypothetical protein
MAYHASLDGIFAVETVPAAVNGLAVVEVVAGSEALDGGIRNEHLEVLIA